MSCIEVCIFKVDPLCIFAKCLLKLYGRSCSGLKEGKRNVYNSENGIYTTRKHRENDWLPRSQIITVLARLHSQTPAQQPKKPNEY